MVTPACKGLPKKGVALKLVIDILKLRQAYLYRGDVYQRHPKAKCCKVMTMSFDAWLGNLTSNKDCLGILVEFQAFLTNMLGDRKCALIPQLQMDYNVIEVFLSL